MEKNQPSLNKPNFSKNLPGNLESEASFRALVENANDGILIANNKGQYLFTNKRMSEIIGYSIEEILQKSLAEITHPAEVKIVNERLQKRIKGEPVPNYYETKIIHKTGRIIDIEVTGTKIVWHGEPCGFVIIRDITRRKQAELALRRSEQRYRAIVEDQTELICRFTSDGTVTFANEVFQKFYSGKAKTVVGKNLFSLFSEKSKKLFLTKINSLSFNKPVQIFEQQDIFQNQKNCWIQWTFHALYDDSSGFSEIQATGRDITHLKKIEAELSEHRDHLEKTVEKRTNALQNVIKRLKQEIIERKRTEEELTIKDFAIQSSLNAMIFLDTQGKILSVNPAFLKLWGYDSESEIIGQPIFSFFMSKREIEPVLHSLNTIGYWMGELTACCRNGILRIVHTSASTVLNENKVPVSLMLTCLDTTPQKKMQAQLVLSERLAASGQLAAFIAHEINSPLQAIKTLLHTLKSRCKEQSEVLTHFDLMENAFDNIRDIVKKLGDLNRPGTRRKQPLDINQVILDTLSLLKIFLEKNRINTIIDLPENDVCVYASPQELSQVFINLINNAVDAIRATNNTSLKTANLNKNEGQIHIKSYLNDEKLVIDITDSGQGVTEAERIKIFDPFYTSKKTMGMGLGLAICSTIIQEHHGTIEAFNCPDMGATFRITLPVYQSKPME